MIFIFCGFAPNGVRYPLVGGTRGRHFAGTNLKPCKLPKNAQTPTSRVHALLARFLLMLNFNCYCNASFVIISLFLAIVHCQSKSSFTQRNRFEWVCRRAIFSDF